MPHIVTELWESTYACKCSGTGGLRNICTYALEIMDLVASLAWLMASICFFPSMSKHGDMLIEGCELMAGGSFVFAVICMVTYAEALNKSGACSLDAWQNALYLIGALMLTIGTLLYWPTVEDLGQLDQYIEEMSYVKALNLITIKCVGSIFFMCGTMMFGFAAFCNGLNLRNFSTMSHQLSVATSSFYMIGSLSFVMGSVSFLPQVGGDLHFEVVGAVSFLLGSLFYVFGNACSLVQKILQPDKAELMDLISQC